MTVSVSVNVVANGIVLFFSMAESIVYMYHVFFIRSSVDGTLGCLHGLATVNSAGVNIGVHDHFELWFSPGICPGMGLLDHMAVLFVVF